MFKRIFKFIYYRLKDFYRQLLLDLGNPEIVKSERINAIYANASTAIDEPANLEKIIKYINDLDWFSAREEGLGDLESVDG